MSKIFKIEFPKSYNDSSIEYYEWMLCWYGRNGAFYQYLFYDPMIRHRVRNEVINSEDPDRVESLVERENRSATLVAEDLSYNDMQIMASLLVNKKIIRLYKDGTQERIALDSNSWRYNITDGRYNLEFEVILSDKYVWK